MDHLPQLQKRSSFRVEVRFLEDARFAYDRNGLEGFPRRCKFTFAKPHDLQTCWESSKFFQSWLFFGTLDEIFKVYNITIQRDDFVSRAENGHATITTKCLQDYIAAWIVSASREYPGCLDSSKLHSTAREVGDYIGSVAGQAVASLIRVARRDPTPIPSAMAVLHNKRQLWSEGMESAKVRAASIWRVLDTAATELRNFGPLSRGIDAAVWDSVLVLCTTLQTAAFFIYRAIPLDASFTVPFNKLPARLSPQIFLENGWCPRELKIISDLVEGDHCALLLCAQLDRRHNLDHSKCSAGKCEAYKVDLATYQTQHHQDCHARSKLLETIMCDQSRLSPSRPTPMAAYCEGQLRLVPVSVRQLLGHPFVAISHVWADGLGNSDANALPRCQLERIQNLVDKQFPNKKGPVPFWMDTLCIPVTKGKPSVYGEAKKSAIKNMEGVYKSSTKVLVLDRTLAGVLSHDMSKEEIGLRIMCSGWARRLWTLQEGLYQAQVHYQFADTTYTFNNLNKAVRQTHAFPARSVTIPETHLLRKRLANPPQCAADYEPLACFAHKALSCCWTRISSFFKELDIKYSQPDPKWFPGMQLVPGMTVLVPRAMRTIAYRTTSRSEDESLILASLTNWRAGSVEPLIEVPAEERMRVCFKTFALVPSQLIFLDQKRYEDTGARWIPKSLLAQSTKLSGFI
ncbi:uncharacterized protein HRG_11783 [Hirsutella rhossiliensis]|uniref:Heterokaryon incompatibility domain-containing protein n=1 Tax=Hirsutella rhossiliensis TaxID=111463 RepID=A0A9P8MLK1_9HYPO|nr:uncharacterized protein HRG_11783 [Hirsutella rhossiliensis]KAH0957234.1 hypothetical protein HRG_11783 [Hirsutella rhossiliensis]